MKKITLAVAILSFIIVLLTHKSESLNSIGAGALIICFISWGIWSLLFGYKMSENFIGGIESSGLSSFSLLVKKISITIGIAFASIVFLSFIFYGVLKVEKQENTTISEIQK
jgi:uncharacterized protein (DUF486 family)